MLSLKEWNRVLEFAKGIEDKEIKTTVYSMYDDRKGIAVHSIDINGNIYRTINSGIWKTADEYFRSIAKAKAELLAE